MQEKINELKRLLKEQCDKVTRTEITDMEDSWEEHLDSEIWDGETYYWERGVTIYLDEALDDVVHENEFSDEELLNILEWAVKPDTVKASIFDW